MLYLCPDSLETGDSYHDKITAQIETGMLMAEGLLFQTIVEREVNCADQIGRSFA